MIIITVVIIVIIIILIIIGVFIIVVTSVITVLLLLLLFVNLFRDIHTKFNLFFGSWTVGSGDDHDTVTAYVKKIAAALKASRIR